MLQELSFQTARVDHRAVNAGHTTDVAGQIKDGEYDLIFMDLPQIGRHVLAHKFHSHMTQLCRWTNLAIAMQVSVIILAPFGKMWLDPQLSALIADSGVNKSYHRLCRLGLKVNPQQSEQSSTCFVIVSNLPIRSNSCHCGDVLHTLHWFLPQQPHQFRLQYGVFKQVAREIVKQNTQVKDAVGLAQSIPDSLITLL